MLEQTNVTGLTKNISEIVGNKEVSLATGFLKYIVGAISALGLLENLVIVSLVLMFPKIRRHPHVFFILCLSFSDALFSATIIMFSVSAHFRLARSVTFCKIEYILLNLSFSSSLGVTLLICLERYLATKRNFYTLRIFINRKTLYVVITWFTSVLYMNAVFLIVQSRTEIDHCKMENLYSNNSYKIIYCALITIYIPLLTIIMILYFATAYTIRNRLRKMDVARLCYPRNETLPTMLADATDTSMNIANNSNVATTVNVISVKSSAVNVIEDSPSSKTNATSTFTTQNPNLTTVHLSASRAARVNNALKTVSIIVAVYVVCLAPVFIEFLLKVFDVSTYQMSNVTRSLTVLNSVANPILYVWRFRDIRTQLKCIKC